MSSFRAEMDLANRDVTLYEFANCIVEHNLEYDNNGVPTLLDLKRPEHVAMLDGPVGEEINDLINEYNDPEGAIDAKSESDTGK
jgi:hypothetical protein